MEGSTKLKVPVGGGISRREEVFYNPHMKLNRDLSVVMCRRLKPDSFLDAMAGSGARGVRAANEAGVNATLNDLNPHAVELIRENAALNQVDVEIVSEDARGLMSKRLFDYVDVDPFGPPVEYADAAVNSVAHNGVLGVCATDTSALSGTYPRACMRKYDAVPLRCDCYNELALRILVGFIARTALRHGRGIEPLFSHVTRHYARAQVRLNRRHSRTLKHLSHLQYCFGCGWRGYRKLKELQRTCGCGSSLETAGPMWNGAYADVKLCGKMTDELSDGAYSRQALSLVQTVAAEQGVDLPYYDLHKLCSRAGVGAPKMSDLEEYLTSQGHAFTRTHFIGVGFKSDAPIESVAAFIEECGQVRD